MTEEQHPRVSVARHCELIFGVVVLIIGLFSYYESATARKYLIYRDGSNKLEFVKFDELCEIEMDPDTTGCPNLSLELYYISADLGCHLVAAVLLLIAGIVYIVFAQQVSTTLSALDNGPGDTPIDTGNYFKITEKRLAGALAIVHALHFGYAAALVWRQ